MIDLKTATGQEVFDYVVEKLYEQGCKSLSKDGSCVYRGPEGVKCAAGWLIPDEKYEPSMENMYWFDLTTNFGLPKRHQFLIEQLQRVHDLYPFEQWGGEFEEIAKGFGLSTEVLKGKDFTAKKP